jgi:hypothetical protein
MQALVVLVVRHERVGTAIATPHPFDDTTIGVVFRFILKKKVRSRHAADSA